MKGLFLPEITTEDFKDGCLESIEALIGEGEIYDIDYSEPCEDAISRQAVFDALSHMCSEDKNGITVSRANVNSMLRGLPPVTPQPKIGHWIKKDGYSDCSECGSHIVTEWDYCPHCGARQESEE